MLLLSQPSAELRGEAAEVGGHRSSGNTDGSTHPSLEGVALCVWSWKRERQQRGRKLGWRKTTPAEDRSIYASFKKARLPLGSGVTSRDVQTGLPRPLRHKIGCKTLRRRLAEKGFIPEQKVEKADFLRAHRLKRLAFVNLHKDKSAAKWAQFLQGCGDFKDFTYYPRKMKARFQRYRCPWTYMRKTEKYKHEFVKPPKGRIFTRKEYKHVTKNKVLGFTASTGQMLVATCPKPWSGEAFARLVRTKVGPFFKQAFPQRRHFRVLVDS